MKSVFKLLLLLLFISSCAKEKSNGQGLNMIQSKQELESNLESGVSFIFYHALWCHICQDLKPTIEELSFSEGMGEVFFGEVD